jgi:hypothetical protein
MRQGEWMGFPDVSRREPWRFEPLQEIAQQVSAGRPRAKGIGLLPLDEIREAHR